MGEGSRSHSSGCRASRRLRRPHALRSPQLSLLPVILLPLLNLFFLASPINGHGRRTRISPGHCRLFGCFRPLGNGHRRSSPAAISSALPGGAAVATSDHVMALLRRPVGLPQCRQPRASSRRGGTKRRPRRATSFMARCHASRSPAPPLWRYRCRRRDDG
jgi:hypothetical protein